MKKSILFISCEEAYHICDKSQYGEATLWEKLKLKLRVSWCKISRNYSKENTKLTETISNADIDCLSNNEQLQLQQQVEQELAKNKH